MRQEVYVVSIALSGSVNTRINSIFIDEHEVRCHDEELFLTGLYNVDIECVALNEFTVSGGEQNK